MIVVKVIQRKPIAVMQFRRVHRRLEIPVKVPIVLQQLATIADTTIREEVRLVAGVQKEVKRLRKTLQAIQAVLSDAEEKQVKDKAVKVWVDNLKDVSYDIDDVLNEWSISVLKLQLGGAQISPVANKKVCFRILLPCLCFSRVALRHEIALKIRDLNERLDVIAKEKDRYSFSFISNRYEPERIKTTSLVDVSEICGRDDDKNLLLSMLLSESSQQTKDPIITSIVGMGGIGKTTLAQLAYNDDEVKAHFQKRIWVCVSDPFDDIRVSKAIIEALSGTTPNLVELENLVQHVCQCIKGKKFLLVLDDVWIEDDKKWEPFKHALKNGAPGSKILVTTRKERVANMIGTTNLIPLGTLSNQECWSLFSRVAFSGRSHEDCVKLNEIGRKIADKCKGLPLAAKTLGGLMRFKKNEENWRNILDSEIWELEEAEKGIFPPLLLSYFDLPPAMRQCFLYCAVFPKDYNMQKAKLIKLWMAQGYLSSKQNIDMEVTGQEYFESLAARSFFQDFTVGDDGDVRCKMHDIVHDFARFLTRNECLVMKIGDVEELSMESSYRNIRHSTLMLAGKEPFPISICSMQTLRTLLLLSKNDSEVSAFLPDLFHHLTRLRALNLSSSSIAEIPKEVGKLIHLRYLDLSYNRDLKELPEIVCHLCHLQTLDLSWCGGLEKLPLEIAKLINLRHLIILHTTSLRFMPNGIGRLSSLQTLSRLIVGGDDFSEACKIEDLKLLNHLHGHLSISGLGNVANVDGARKAELKYKKHIVSLNLDFSPEEAERKMDDVLEALEPHPNLEDFKIWRYNGKALPNWVVSLIQLKELQLWRCANLECLSPLEELPSLEFLDIWYLSSLRTLGLEFLGLVMDDNTTNAVTIKNFRGTISPVFSFPKLKKLRFWGMSEWEEWDFGDKNVGLAIMPCLLRLELNDCPRLKALPYFIQTTRLQELIIYNCTILKQRLQRGMGEDWPKISHVPNFEMDYECLQKDGHPFIPETQKFKRERLRI